MSKVKICLVGESILTNEAIKYYLIEKGFETFSYSLKTLFERNLIHALNPEIILFEKHILYSQGQSVFELWTNSDKKYQRIFILDDRSMQFLGVGLSHGIEGFVHEKGGLRELETCLLKVLKSDMYISPYFAGSKNLNGKSENKLIPKDIHLTSQEIKVLKLVRQKKTSREISNILRITKKTVQNHRQNISNKLGLRGQNKLYEFSKLYFD